LAGTLVKIVGGNLAGNDIENAASEYTLKELLKTMNTMNKTGPNSKKAAKELADLAKSSKDATDATEELSDAKRTLKTDINLLRTRGFRLLGEGISKFANGITIATENIANFTANLIQSQPDVTDLSRALADSRLNVLGLGTVIHRVTEMLMVNYRSFQTLTQSGMMLGERIETLQSDFAGMGVDARTLTSVLVDNAEFFARFGSASEGATRALNGMKSITSDTRDQLLRFGISYEEQTEIFARGFAKNTVALRRGTITQEQVINSTARYAKDLRRLSELTGASADKQEDARRRLEAQIAFQIELDAMRAQGLTQQAEQIEQLAAQEYSQSEGSGDLFIGQFLGLGAALSDAAGDAAGMTIGLAESQARLISIARERELQEGEIVDLYKDHISGIAGMNSSIDLATAAMVATGSSGMQTALRYRQMGINIENDSESMAGNFGAAGETILTFEAALLELRSGFSDLVTTFLVGGDDAAEQRKEIVEKMTAALIPIFSAIGTVIKDVLVTGISELWKNTYVLETMVAGILALWAAPAVVSALAGKLMSSGAAGAASGAAGAAGAAGSAVLKALRLARFTPAAMAAGVAYEMFKLYQRGPASEEEMARLRNEGNFETFQEDWMNFGVEEGRRIGTLKATGMRAEPRDTVAKIHAGERVLNPQETQEYNSQSGSQRTVVEKLDQLNNTMMAVASLMSQELAIQTRTMNNISGLGSDLMKGMP
jgi:hypothetical protein